jgi:HPt (histidine-containing phosphotransfer) domain-containing protein
MTGDVRLDDLIQVCRSGDWVDHELLKEMLSLFIHENARRLDAARDAARLADHTELRSAIHAVKGSAALVGADDLHRLATELEREVMNGSAIDLLGATEQLQQEFAAVVSTLYARYPDLRPA